MASNSIFRDPSRSDAVVGQRDVGVVEWSLRRRAVAVAETIPRWAANATLSPAVSGRLYLVGVVLPAGVPVSKITFVSSSTAAGTPLNQWFSLYDKNRGKLAVTADDTTTAWAGSSEKTLTLASPYTPTVTDFFYLGWTVVASTMPTLLGISTSGVVAGLAPVLGGASTTGLTDPTTAPTTAAAIAGGVVAYAYTS